MVSPHKIEKVEKLAQRVSQAETIGLIDIRGVPSKQFQQIRKNLREKAYIKVGKNTLMKRAFEKAGLKKMAEETEGSVGIISSPLDPPQLNKILKENKTQAPAKAGDLAPYDIIIPKGDTPLKPGPIVGKLQKLGIKAQIKEGKIIVREDSLVVKEGDPIPEELAALLPRFGIEPREVSLDMKVVQDESGTLYTPEILKIDQGMVLSQMNEIQSNALNLALNLNILNSVTAPFLIQNAYQNVFNLSLNAEIINQKTIPVVLQRAHSQVSSLSKVIPEKEKVKEEKKEEKEGKKEKPEKEEAETKKEEGPKEEKPSMNWLKKDLKKYAKQHDIEIKSSDTKKDILKKIEKSE